MSSIIPPINSNALKNPQENTFVVYVPSPEDFWAMSSVDRRLVLNQLVLKNGITYARQLFGVSKDVRKSLERIHLGDENYKRFNHAERFEKDTDILLEMLEEVYKVLPVSGPQPRVEDNFNLKIDLSDDDEEDEPIKSKPEVKKNEEVVVLPPEIPPQVRNSCAIPAHALTPEQAKAMALYGLKPDCTFCARIMLEKMQSEVDKVLQEDPEPEVDQSTAQKQEEKNHFVLKPGKFMEQKDGRWVSPSSPVASPALEKTPNVAEISQSADAQEGAEGAATAAVDAASTSRLYGSIRYLNQTIPYLNPETPNTAVAPAVPSTPVGASNPPQNTGTQQSHPSPTYPRVKAAVQEICRILENLHNGTDQDNLPQGEVSDFKLTPIKPAVQATPPPPPPAPRM